jgi:hypothetical protein
MLQEENLRGTVLGLPLGHDHIVTAYSNGLVVSV